MIHGQQNSTQPGRK